MPGDSSNPSPWQEPEEFLRKKFGAVQEEVGRSVKDVTDFTHRNPERALLWAVATGYLLRIVPLGQILGAIVRVLVSLLKPAALIYGGIKIWQQAQAVVADNRSSQSTRSEPNSPGR